MLCSMCCNTANLQHIVHILIGFLLLLVYKLLMQSCGNFNRLGTLAQSSDGKMEEKVCEDCGECASVVGLGGSIRCNSF